MTSLWHWQDVTLDKRKDDLMTTSEDEFSIFQQSNFVMSQLREKYWCRKRTLYGWEKPAGLNAECGCSSPNNILRSLRDNFSDALPALYTNMHYHVTTLGNLFTNLSIVYLKLGSYGTIKWVIQTESFTLIQLRCGRVQQGLMPTGHITDYFGDDFAGQMIQLSPS